MKNRALIVFFFSIAGQLFGAQNSPTLADKKATRQQRQEKAKCEIEKFGGLSNINQLTGKIEQSRAQRAAKKP
jgi:hypothetical protein